MKVLLLAGADSIHTLRWVNSLSEAGLKVVLVSQHPLLDGYSDDISVRLLPYRGHLGYFLNVVALRRIIRIEKPDLLNAHYASGYGTTARLARFRPTLLSVWGADVYDFPQITPIHKQWIRANLRAADRIASTSRVMGNQVNVIAPEIGNIAITPFGVDTNVFVPSNEDIDQRDEAPIVIGTIKTLSEKYGIDTFIDSAALAMDQLRVVAPSIAARIRVRIVGEGPLRSALEQQANDRGIGCVTEFTGFVPHAQVPQELQRLDIYVALSRLDSESFGVAIVEAGACGLPVVVSNVGGLPEVVDNERTGLVVRKEDAQAAADALVSLVLDRSRRVAMGLAARKHVLSRYRWEDNVQTMIEVYRSMVRS